MSGPAGPEDHLEMLRDLRARGILSATAFIELASEISQQQDIELATVRERLHRLQGAATAPVTGEPSQVELTPPPSPQSRRKNVHERPSPTKSDVSDDSPSLMSPLNSPILSPVRGDEDEHIFDEDDDEAFSDDATFSSDGLPTHNDALEKILRSKALKARGEPFDFQHYTRVMSSCTVVNRHHMVS